MSGITEKSTGVSQLQEEKLTSVPIKSGIFVLRNIPTLNGIIYIGYAENLNETLRSYLVNGEIPEAEWFDWYRVEDVSEAEKIVKEWVDKYSPKYNLT